MARVVEADATVVPHITIVLQKLQVLLRDQAAHPEQRPKHSHLPPKRYKEDPDLTMARGLNGTSRISKPNHLMRILHYL